ncbi:FAD-binding oxidoreductase [Lujinxingia sediminis]|uniref:FAD-binding oxidoreductase n=2 Tax=Lujinxingia sediminis TaxID=2480984 RepID=A0ABY0CYR1_9DELT|nr:FAD-binding oxidoreductase [Lujinxingia sediminis]
MTRTSRNSLMTTTSWASKPLAGWGRYPIVEALCARPESQSQTLNAFNEREGDAVLAHGFGRSYGDAALLSQGRVVLTRRLKKMLAFDETSGVLRVEAGVTIGELIEVFLPRGWFVPVVPGTQFVSVGGAIGCNIHGKNHGHAGCFGDHVLSMEVLLASGEVVRCSRAQHDDLFWATIGGMGLTGIILSAEIQLQAVESGAIEMESIRFNNLDEFFQISEESTDYFHTVSWIDCVKGGSQMGRGIFMRGRHASAEQAATLSEGPLERVVELVQRALDGRAFESNLLLNRATIRLFNEAYYHKHPAGELHSVVGYEPFFFPLDAVENWNYVYGKRGFLQYQMVVPEREAVRDILKVISESKMASFLAVIKEFGDQDHGGLSFPCGGTTLALDFPNFGEPLLAMMERLDALVAEVGGRIYLGKDARLSAEMFRRMYPTWEAWREVRDRWDPQGVFQSDLSRRLGLTPG